MAFILEIKIGRKHVRDVGDQLISAAGVNIFRFLDLDDSGSALLKSSHHQTSNFVAGLNTFSSLKNRHQFDEDSVSCGGFHLLPRKRYVDSPDIKNYHPKLLSPDSSNVVL